MSNGGIYESMRRVAGYLVVMTLSGEVVSVRPTGETPTTGTNVSVTDYTLSEYGRWSRVFYNALKMRDPHRVLLGANYGGDNGNGPVQMWDWMTNNLHTIGRSSTEGTSDAEYTSHDLQASERARERVRSERRRAKSNRRRFSVFFGLLLLSLFFRACPAWGAAMSRRRRYGVTRVRLLAAPRRRARRRRSPSSPPIPPPSHSQFVSAHDYAAHLEPYLGDHTSAEEAAADATAINGSDDRIWRPNMYANTIYDMDATSGDVVHTVGPFNKQETYDINHFQVGARVGGVPSVEHWRATASDGGRRRRRGVRSERVEGTPRRRNAWASEREEHRRAPPPSSTIEPRAHTISPSLCVRDDAVPAYDRLLLRASCLMSQVLGDGTAIINGRATGSFRKVDLATNKTLWICGGQYGNFTVVDTDGHRYAPGTKFLWDGQHNLEYFGHGEFLMFDNNYNNVAGTYIGGSSRPLRLQLDEEAFVATITYVMVCHGMS